MIKKFKTPEDAENAFYIAIEQCDIEALSQIWSANDSIVCIHPGAGRIVGREDVLDSFLQMFEQSPHFGFTLSDSLQSGFNGLAIHQVREEIKLDGQLLSMMVSTNVFHEEDGGWRMLLHHSSFEPEQDSDDDFDDDDDDDDDFDDFDDFDDTLDTPPVLH